MGEIKKNLTQLIGNTPMLELATFSVKNKLKATLIAKLESFNPGGSVKDRAALAMIEDAEQKNLIHPGATLIEPTSGNTGIGLAWVAKVKGYHLILTMPESMTIERRQLLKVMGAELHLTTPAKGMAGAIEAAQELRDTIPGSIILQQFENNAYPVAHQKTTAQEIWKDTKGKIDIFVAGVGTGGTITGVSDGLKAHNTNIKIVAVEPDGSPVITEGKVGPHKIQGIGANFIPKNYHAESVDEVMRVTDKEAFETTKELMETEGLLVGISSGAAVFAAKQLALRPENKGKMIVVLLPDTGERYLSVFDV